MNVPATLFYSSEAPLLRLAWHEPSAQVAVPEVVVQEIWRAQRLRAAELRTTGGLPVQVLDPGTLNVDGGPDFRNARLRIGDTVWFGDVEIHTTSRGWIDHGHNRDARYGRVVLHVALYPDLWTGSLVRSDGTALPELVLSSYLDSHLRERLVQFFTRQAQTRPCAWGVHHVPAAEREVWLRTCAEARLARRAERYALADDPAQLLYEDVAAALGHRPNTEPMRELARRVSRHDLATLRSSRDREALLFGMAGLLPDDATPIECPEARARIEDLRTRFIALQPRDTHPMDALAWQYARLRPSNFPELRIAQFAALAHQTTLFSPGRQQQLAEMLLGAVRPDTFFDLLSATPDPFWTVHYRFARAAAYHSVAIGRETRLRLLVNVLIPAALAALPRSMRAAGTRQALHLLGQMPPEDNHLVRGFNPEWIAKPSLVHTQGMHELDTAYCGPQRCLACAVGKRLLAPPDSVSSSHSQPDSSCSSASFT